MLFRSEIRKNDGKDINVLKWMSRAALEYIGQGGLGYSFDALDENKTNKYSEVAREFRYFNMNNDLIIIRNWSS